MAKQLTEKQVKILGDVVAALRDKNIMPVIETINQKNSVSMDTPQLPNRYNPTIGTTSLNRRYAESARMGPNISIKRIRRPDSPTGHKDRNGNEIYVNNGWHYVVRTQSGEATFSNADKDFMTAWGAILGDYDNGKGYNYMNIKFENETLAEIHGAPAVLKDEKTKYEQSQDRLSRLGVVKGKKFGEPNAITVAQILANEEAQK